MGIVFSGVTLNPVAVRSVDDNLEGVPFKPWGSTNYPGTHKQIIIKAVDAAAHIPGGFDCLDKTAFPIIKQIFITGTGMQRE